MFLIVRLALLSFFLLALPQLGYAESGKSTPKMLGSFGGWKAYSYDDNNQPVCYMTLVPKFTPVKKMKRGQAYLTITHRPSESSKDVVSYVAGYNFKTTSDVVIEAASKSYNLFTQRDTAWSRDSATDHALSASIRESPRLKITGTPDGKNAAPIVDSIDLKGANDAYRAISKACGYPVSLPTKAKVPAKGQ